MSKNISFWLLGTDKLFFWPAMRLELCTPGVDHHTFTTNFFLCLPKTSFYNQPFDSKDALGRHFFASKFDFVDYTSNNIVFWCLTVIHCNYFSEITTSYWISWILVKLGTYIQYFNVNYLLRKVDVTYVEPFVCSWKEYLIFITVLFPILVSKVVTQSIGKKREEYFCCKGLLF